MSNQTKVPDLMGDIFKNIDDKDINQNKNMDFEDSDNIQPNQVQSKGYKMPSFVQEYLPLKKSQT